MYKGNENAFEDDKWTDSKGPGFQWTEEEKDIEAYDILDVLHGNDWCTEFSTTITSITDGYVDTSAGTGLCGIGSTFDGTEYEIPFVAPVIASPTCTDTGQLWKTFVEVSDYDGKKFRVAVDMDANKIMVKTINGKNHGDDLL